MSPNAFGLALLAHPGVLTDEEELCVYRFIAKREAHLETAACTTLKLPTASRKVRRRIALVPMYM